MRSLPSSALLVLLTACSVPRFAATRTIDYELPTEGVQRLACETHNGGITVVGDSAAKVIVLRAVLTARAPSQVEADTLLDQLDVVRDIADGCLTVHGKGPDSGWTTNTSFAFTITLPPQVALDLQSHNGELTIHGAAATVRAETHNGGITGDVGSGDLAATTHNGQIDLAIGNGMVRGTVESHNGGIRLGVGIDQDLTLRAQTDNGSIGTELPLQDVVRERGNLTGRLGAGKGSLTVTTHNGDITLR